jgi:hypothetical protein
LLNLMLLMFSNFGFIFFFSFLFPFYVCIQFYTIRKYTWILKRRKRSSFKLGMFQFQVRFSFILFIVLNPIRDEADPLGSTLNHNFKGFGNLTFHFIIQGLPNYSANESTWWYLVLPSRLIMKWKLEGHGL